MVVVEDREMFGVFGAGWEGIGLVGEVTDGRVLVLGKDGCWTEGLVADFQRYWVGE